MCADKFLSLPRIAAGSSVVRSSAGTHRVPFASFPPPSEDISEWEKKDGNGTEKKEKRIDRPETENREREREEINIKERKRGEKERGRNKRNRGARRYFAVDAAGSIA